MIKKLQVQYEQLWLASKEKFKHNKFELNRGIRKEDTRRGITIIAKFKDEQITHMERFIDEIRNIEPKQYYYKGNELHLTVLSIISCELDFVLEEINLDEYISTISEAIREVEPFHIQFRGVTASSSCVLLQGFPLDNTLITLRDNLREIFQRKSIRNTIDKRYKIDTAHTTIVRFQEEITNNKTFIKLLERFRNTDFKLLHVTDLYLVYNDWYHTADKTVVLSKISL